MIRFKSPLIGLTALLAAASGFAQTASQDSVNQKLQDLDQQIRVLNRLREIDQEDAKAAAATRGKVLADDKGLGVSSADGAFSFKLRGFIQSEALFFKGNAGVTSSAANPNVTTEVPALDNFTIRRLYSDLVGTVYKNFDYHAQLDFSAGAATILDANLDWRILPEFNLRVGKFKPPTGLERLLPAPRSPFIEGSFVTLLEPNRDLGLQFFGDIGKGLVEYQAGVFAGARDGANNTTDNNDQKDLNARVFVLPFVHGDIEALQGLGVGISGSYGRQNQVGGAALPSYTTGHQTFFAYGATDTSIGLVKRYSPQAYYYYGPLGVIAEYASTEQKVSRGIKEDVTNTAWSVTASVFLTGEKNAYKSIKVKKPNTFPSLDGIGAIEVLGRVHQISVDDNVFNPLTTNLGNLYADPAKNAKQATGYDAALGWYLNNDVKIYASYEHTEFKDGAGISPNTIGSTAAIARNRSDENVVSLSFNVAY